MTTETKVEAVAADELAEHLGFNIEIIPSVQREAIESEVAVVLKVADRFHQSALDALRGEVVTAERRVAKLEAVLEQAMAHPDFLPPGLLEAIESALTKESP